MAKESSIPSLISELKSCDCDSDRERAKMRFLERFYVLDTKLNHLVKMNATNIDSIVKSCSQTMNILSDSRAKCQMLKDRILSCKDMLQCKRDEIRKLWLDSLQHKYVHQMLAEIQKLTKIPGKVNKLLNSKQFIQTTEILVSSACLLEGDFKGIESLAELRNDLNHLKEKLYLIFNEELRQELYWSTFHSIFNASENNCQNYERETYEKMFLSKTWNLNDDRVSLNASYVKILLECISLLQKCPEILEFLKENCQIELIRIVKKLSKLMFDIIHRSTEQLPLDMPESQQQNFLVDLLNSVFYHFRFIASNYVKFLSILDNIVPNASSYDSCMQVNELYSNIQIILEQLISNYLEQQSLTSTSSPPKVSVFSNSQNLNELSSFFEAHVDRECPSLFKFSNSSDGMKKIKKAANCEPLSKPSSSDSDLNLKNLTIVCKPAVKNITLIFIPLKEFVLIIDSLLSLKSGSHCLLHTFLYDSAHVFLDQVNSEINRILENASISLESWIMVPPSDDESGSEKRILSSTLVLNNNLKELQLLVTKLPDYSNHFLHLIYYVILDYKDMLQKAFKNLFGEDHNILSVSWAKDRDIRRLLKSFSNWRHLEDNKSGEGIAFPEEVRLRNREESQLLIRNLHSEEHGSWGIIHDLNTLLNLAVLQESSQWFSAELLSFMKEFSQITRESDQTTFNSINGLKKLVKEYEDFADVCLLALHLEVRAHCFHYLLPRLSDGVTFDAYLSQDFESSVQKLTVDLTNLDETLHPVLTSKELKYIFEGLGELIASILIHNISSINAASDNLVKRMSRCVFIIQCCLSNITLAREVALERTRKYIQLLNLSCDDILNEIMEEGPLFKENEYASLFRIILAKEGSSEVLIDDYVLKLQKILKRISVTI